MNQETEKYAEWRTRDDGTLFPPYLNVELTWELMNKRFRLSKAVFFDSYRHLFPFEYYAIRRGKPALKRISWERANEVIDRILEG